MDAQHYYTQGINAIKQGDIVNGRKLLLQSLKLNKNNDRAWLWLSRTMADNNKKLECVERALAINPNNQDAQKYKQQLLQQSTPRKPKGKNNPIRDRQRIRQLLAEADTLARSKDRSAAVNKWESVLEIEYDHEEAMKNAVQYYIELNMLDGAKELLYHAVDLGTDNAMILLTARDIAKTEITMERYDALCEMIASQEWVTPKQVISMANSYIKEEAFDHAVHVLQSGLTVHIDHPELLNTMAQVHEATGRENLALQYYERVANTAVRSKVGKEADKRLAAAVPMLTDSERGSGWMAWREVFGVFTLFFLLAFQDAGLNLANLGPNRLMGILLSLVGSYLFITATSSPQQKPIAKILGGRLPMNNPKSPQRRMNSFVELIASLGVDVKEENFYVGPIHEPTRLPVIPEWMRWVFGITGGLMLFFAFYLVMTTAMGLLGLPELYLDPQFYEAMSEINR